MKQRCTTYVLFIFLCATLLGCEKAPPTLSQTIDFSEGNLPDFVAEVKGLSEKEDWGRWSDADVAPTVTIRFKKPLPKTFMLTITAQANARNDSPMIRIGSFEQSILIQKIRDEIEVPVELNDAQDTIEIIPQDPISPRKLNINGDSRKLGVGLYSLKIES